MDCDDDLHFLIRSEDTLERIDADPWLADDRLFELGYEYPLSHHRTGVVDRHLHRLRNLQYSMNEANQQPNKFICIAAD